MLFTKPDTVRFPIAVNDARLAAEWDLEDAHKPEHNYNDDDGDNQTEDTAHIRSLQDVSDEANSDRSTVHKFKRPVR